MLKDSQKSAISITLDGELLREITELAAKMNRSRSAFIEGLIRDGLARRREFVADMENPVFSAVAAAIASQPKIAQALVKTFSGQLDDDQKEWLERGLKEQVELGRERAKAKKSSSGKVVPG